MECFLDENERPEKFRFSVVMVDRDSLECSKILRVFQGAETDVAESSGLDSS